MNNDNEPILFDINKLRKAVPCAAEQMNALEKNLIRTFNATSSYNSTAGGSKRR